MREVIRNHQHSSKIVLCKCINQSEIFFEKSSYTSEGIGEIKNELKGYQWYFSKVNSNHKIQVNCDIQGYCNIRIPNFNAVPCQGAPDISKYFDYAIRAIDCYHNIWSKSDKSFLQPIHGDFSLEGNILFGQSEVYVIDWEHFHLEMAPLGFDLLYMVFELIKVQSKLSSPSKEHLSLARELILYANSLNTISKFYKDNYFSSYLLQQNRIRSVWKEQYNKLPTTQFSESQVQHISKYFDQRN